MITHEATCNNKIVSTLCQTSPLDGGNKERNAEELQKWKESMKEKHENVKFQVFLD